MLFPNQGNPRKFRNSENVEFPKYELFNGTLPESNGTEIVRKEFSKLLTYLARLRSLQILSARLI